MRSFGRQAWLPACAVRAAVMYRDVRVEEISVGDVLRALEGNLDPVECPGIQNSSGCDGSDVCVTKYVWQRINDSINRTVDEIKLSELLEESRAVQKKSQIPGSCCEKKE